MKSIFFIFYLVFCTLAYAQKGIVNEMTSDATPQWVLLMYSENPNIFEVDAAYHHYYNAHQYVKNKHTQHYKRWRRSVDGFINTEGHYDSSIKSGALEKIRDNYINGSSSDRAGNWSVIGPFENFREGGVPSGAQTNIASLDQYDGNANILYSGTESGEVYKSVDAGENWFNVSYSLVTAYAPNSVIASAGVSAIAIHPTNPDIVYAGAADEVFKTTDGGVSWNVVFQSNIFLPGYKRNPAEIHILESNPQIVLIAGKEGMYRTNNAGLSWTQVMTDECFDIKSKPNFPNTLYSVRRNTSTVLPEFYISIDGGLSWNQQTLGWYNSTDPNRSLIGGRIAVSDADINRIYVFLCGNSKTGDNGFIGVYRSDDGGVNWTNNMGYDGGPYSDPAHPNLLTSSPVGGFNQGFYNCAIMASNTNPDEILVGGIGMWKSYDGGVSFNCMHNYSCPGTFYPMHVDQQDYRAYGNTYWATTDGGIFKSDDFFGTQPEFKMRGIHGADFWGFGTGWNYDIMAGGTFHNGVDVYTEGYPFGHFLDLGGGEPASGYVNPGDTLKIYSTNLGGKIVPSNINGAVTNAGLSMTPNESPWYAQSSEMEFSPSCYNHVYLGNDNQLFKSLNGGSNFTAKYTHPDPNSRILGIEISRQNPDKMYIIAQPDNGACTLIKTTDDWDSFSQITLPTGSSHQTLISIDPQNDEIIWAAYARGANSNKIHKSEDGGASWTNETTADLNFQTIQDIVTIGGTDGGVYLGTNGTVYYKSNSMSTWTLDNANLPAIIGTTKLRPFYRDGKIRLASYGKGVWESELFESPSFPVAKIMVDKLTALCIIDTFYFDDYSMLNHTGATWEWTFENANINTSSLRNPKVVFNNYGSNLATLTVTNAQGNSDTDSLYIELTPFSALFLQEDFEGVFEPEHWSQNSTAGNLIWKHVDTIGGHGLSSSCMHVDNFFVGQQGNYCDMHIPVNSSMLVAGDAWLTFDVAYTPYAPNYSDSLEVLVSEDCGNSWISVYSKPGDLLATVPQPQTQVFIPGNNDWRTDSIDLSAYTGNGLLYIAFRNHNSYGQNLYIDNINLGDVVFTQLEETSNNYIQVYPNPVTNLGIIHLESNKSETVEFALFDLNGKLIFNEFVKSDGNISLADKTLAYGTYIYTIRSENNIYKGKIVIQ